MLKGAGGMCEACGVRLWEIPYNGTGINWIFSKRYASLKSLDRDQKMRDLDGIGHLTGSDPTLDWNLTTHISPQLSPPLRECLNQSSFKFKTRASNSCIFGKKGVWSG